MYMYTCICMIHVCLFCWGNALYKVEPCDIYLLIKQIGENFIRSLTYYCTQWMYIAHVAAEWFCCGSVMLFYPFQKVIFITCKMDVKYITWIINWPITKEDNVLFFGTWRKLLLSFKDFIIHVHIIHDCKKVCSHQTFSSFNVLLVFLYLLNIRMYLIQMRKFWINFELILKCWLTIININIAEPAAI